MVFGRLGSTSFELAIAPSGASILGRGVFCGLPPTAMRDGHIRGDVWSGNLDIAISLQGSALQRTELVALPLGIGQLAFFVASVSAIVAYRYNQSNLL